jgi:hypothetical protein
MISSTFAGDDSVLSADEVSQTTKVPARTIVIYTVKDVKEQ